MKIFTKQEFYNLPPGTLYSEYEPCIFSGLKIKNDTIYHEGMPIDFFYQDLIGNVRANSTGEFIEILDKSEKDSSEFILDFDGIERDGIYDDDVLYAVYNTDEIFSLSNKITGCKGWEINTQ